MRLLSVVLRKARSLARFSFFEFVLVIPVFVLLGLARLAILTLPFRIYARKLGAQKGLSATPQSLSEPELKRAKSIGRVVRAVANITPWASLCLAQSMVATLLMRIYRLPYCTFFGLAKGDAKKGADPLSAHAWTMADTLAITGGHGLGKFTVVMVFEYRKRSTS